MADRRTIRREERMDRRFLGRFGYHLLWPVLAAVVLILIGLYVVIF